MKKGVKYLVSIFLFFGCTRTTITNHSVSDSTHYQTQSHDSIPAPDSIPASISIESGNNQTGLRGSTLPNALFVIVKNKSGKPLNGIRISFTPCTGCGIAYADTITTDLTGLAGTVWQLGSLPDSNESVVARVVDVPGLFVNFHAAASDLEKGNFAGTLNMIDTSISEQQMTMGGAPDFPVLPYNTDLPLIMKGVGLNSGSRVIDSMQLIVNGHALTGATVQSGNGRIELSATEEHDYPPSTSGQLLQYIMFWDFNGTIVNNIYSGTFSLIVYSETKGTLYETTGHTNRIEYWRYGVFSTTVQ